MYLRTQHILTHHPVRTISPIFFNQSKQNQPEYNFEKYITIYKKNQNLKTHLVYLFTVITHMNHYLHKMLMSNVLLKLQGTPLLYNAFLLKSMKSNYNCIQIGTRIFDFTEEIKDSTQQSRFPLPQLFIEKYIGLHSEKCKIIEKCIEYDSILTQWESLFISSLSEQNNMQHAYMSTFQQLQVLNNH